MFVRRNFDDNRTEVASCITDLVGLKLSNDETEYDDKDYKVVNDEYDSLDEVISIENEVKKLQIKMYCSLLHYRKSKKTELCAYFHNIPHAEQCKGNAIKGFSYCKTHISAHKPPLQCIFIRDDPDIIGVSKYCNVDYERCTKFTFGLRGLCFDHSKVSRYLSFRQKNNEKYLEILMSRQCDEIVSRFAKIEYSDEIRKIDEIIAMKDAAIKCLERRKHGVNGNDSDNEFDIDSSECDDLDDILSRVKIEDEIDE